MPVYRLPDRGTAIGARIWVARVVAGLSRASLGAHLGMSSQQVQKYEAGLSRLPAVMLEDLGRVLGRPPVYFVETDHAALAAAVLLQLPDGGLRRRQLDVALARLEASMERPAARGAAREGHPTPPEAAHAG